MSGSDDIVDLTHVRKEEYETDKTGDGIGASEIAEAASSLKQSGSGKYGQLPELGGEFHAPCRIGIVQAKLCRYNFWMCKDGDW